MTIGWPDSGDGPDSQRHLTSHVCTVSCARASRRARRAAADPARARRRPAPAPLARRPGHRRARRPGRPGRRRPGRALGERPLDAGRPARDERGRGGRPGRDRPGATPADAGSPSAAPRGSSGSSTWDVQTALGYYSLPAPSDIGYMFLAVPALGALLLYLRGRLPRVEEIAVYLDAAAIFLAISRPHPGRLRRPGRPPGAARRRGHRRLPDRPPRDGRRRARHPRRDAGPSRGSAGATSACSASPSWVSPGSAGSRTRPSPSRRPGSLVNDLFSLGILCVGVGGATVRAEAPVAEPRRSRASRRARRSCRSSPSSRQRRPHRDQGAGRLDARPHRGRRGRDHRPRPASASGCSSTSAAACSTSRTRPTPTSRTRSPGGPRRTRATGSSSSTSRPRSTSTPRTPTSPTAAGSST